VLAATGVAVAVGVPPLEDVRGWVAAAGWAGPVLYAAVYAGLSLTPVPVSVLSVAAGMLFGLGTGLVVSLAATFTAAAIGFALARRLGRGSMIRLQQRDGPTSARLRALDGLLRRRGLLAVVGVRLAPLLPFAVLNMGCGLTAVRLRDYAIGTVIGMAPGETALVAVGAHGAEPGSLPFLLSVGGLALVVVLGVVVARRHRATRPAA
jgi:uncharacterized membrane protein YdjX (TVP38/TMEM64 family)